MNRSEERELFLRYLSDIYLQNPDLPISYETIYVELLRFNMSDGLVAPTAIDSLINVQASLNNKYRNNDNVNTFLSSDGNFWAIENRMGKADMEYLTDIYNGIKMYVPVSSDNIYKISESLFDFMIEEDIVMQCKISKEMRNDALVCRVRTKEDAEKVSSYINSLGYSSSARGNPFLYDDGNVCMAIDGCLSYNVMVSKVLKEYLYTNRVSHSLDKTSISHFYNFISSQLEYLESNQKKAFMDLYQISDEEEYKDFITILRLVSSNLSGKLDKEELYSYQDTNYVRIGQDSDDYNGQDEARILYVINTLATYYSVDYVHKIIMAFIQNGNYNLFTRQIGEFGGVRAIMENNFSKEDVKKIISDIGWKAFIGASRVTYEKYGEEQLFCAIKNVFNGDGIKEFTNDYDVRSRLGLVIPPELLREVIINKLNESGMNISSIALANLVIEEIEKEDNKKVNGRK